MTKRAETGLPGEGVRRGRLRAVAALLPALTRAATRRHGPAYAAVMCDWREIVGAELAALCRPEKLSQTRGGKSGAVLHVRAQGPAATDLQHMEPTILARINAHLGYRAVERLRIFQGTVATTLSDPSSPSSPAATVAAPVRGAEPELPQVTDDRLRAVLRRLGAWTGTQATPSKAAASKARL